MKEPAVLLLDEPLSALDPQIREEMQSELSSLQRQLGMTFIMVTHDQGEALALSHNVAVFCHGNLEQVGSPENIYDTPRTKFVAQFIGQSNLLPCTYRRSTPACIPRLYLMAPNLVRTQLPPPTSFPVKNVSSALNRKHCPFPLKKQRHNFHHQSISSAAPS